MWVDADAGTAARENLDSAQPAHDAHPLAADQVSPLMDTNLFMSPERPSDATARTAHDAGPVTPATHHLIFATRENNTGSAVLPADGRILSASELVPLPTTTGKQDAGVKLPSSQVRARAAFTLVE